MSQVNDLGPVPDVASERSDREDYFEVFFGTTSTRNRAIKMEGGLGWRPATDVFETTDEFVIQVDLAGMREEAIEVFVDEGYVTIKGTRANVNQPGKKHYHKMEIMVGPFERHIRLPEWVDVSTAQARYESGFLFVRMERGQGRCDERTIISIES